MRVLHGIMAVGVCGLASLASASVNVVAPDVTTSASGSFVVGVQITSPSTAFMVNGYFVDLAIVPHAGSTGTVSISSVVVPDTNALGLTPFASIRGAASNISELSANDDFNQYQLSNGTNLFKVNYQVAPGASGLFDLKFDSSGGDPSMLLNAIDVTAVPAGVAFNNGSLTVVPEPASMAVLVLGAMGLAARKRRV